MYPIDNHYHLVLFQYFEIEFYFVTIYQFYFVKYLISQSYYWIKFCYVYNHYNLHSKDHYYYLRSLLFDFKVFLDCFFVLNLLLNSLKGFMKLFLSANFMFLSIMIPLYWSLHLFNQVKIRFQIYHYYFLPNHWIFLVTSSFLELCPIINWMRLSSNHFMNLYK